MATVAWRECAMAEVSQSRVGRDVGGSGEVVRPVLGVSTTRHATCGNGPSLHGEAGSGGPNAVRFLPPWTKTWSAGHRLSRLSGGPRSWLCTKCLLVMRRPECRHGLPRGYGTGTLGSTLASCSLCLVGTSVGHTSISTARCAEQPTELCGPLVLGRQVQAYFLHCAKSPS